MKEFKNTVLLLRFPFSLFLLPISLFSFFYIHPPLSFTTFLVLGIWHLLVFPASNGYNSYNDRDEGPIGGLGSPPLPTRWLFYAANILDAGAVILALLVNVYFSFFVVVYIVASRLYSARNIRLKKYPVLGFMIVFFFQGAWVFCGNIIGLASLELLSYKQVIFSAAAASFFIGTVYPLTQIYQHEADKKDGVMTLSMLLGLRGTFIFSGTMFGIATLLMYLSFNFHGTPGNFWIFNALMLVSTIYFLRWAVRSFKNTEHANFKNAMIMLLLSSMSNNIYFLILLNT